MNALERYGAALIKYEGAADVTFPDGSGIVYKGYFEVKQLKAGGIAIGFVPLLDDKDYPSGTTTLRFVEPRFYGRDLDSWELTSWGKTSPIPIIGFFSAPKGAAHPAEVFSAQGIKARRKGATDSGYGKARFLISNLIWHFGSNAPKPLNFDAGGLKVTVIPVADYREIVDSIKAVRGIAPTADVLIETSDHRKLPLMDFAEFMNSLVYVFRLVTGNRIDWLFGEALDDKSGKAVERLHKDAITGPFSKTLRIPPGTLDFEGLTNAFFDTHGPIVKQNDLKKLIDYFVNCCDETSYLEARGLLASTLADLIVLTHSEVMDCQNVIQEDDFNTQVLPALEAAIRGVESPGLSNRLRQRALQQLKGAYRNPFGKRLELLVKECNLSLGYKDRERAVNIRNKLVHEGNFLSVNRNDWYGEYRFMIWFDFVALCRLAGYKGELPSSIVS